MNTQLGKKLTLIGFGGMVVVGCVRLLFGLLNIAGPLTTLCSICSSLLFPALAALGFGILWLCTRDLIDLVTGGAIGLSILLSLIQQLFNLKIYAGTASAILCAIIFSLYFLILAFRAKSYAPLLALLLGCAFVYQVAFSWFYGIDLFQRLQAHIPAMLLTLGLSLINIACDALCFLQAKTET